MQPNCAGMGCFPFKIGGGDECTVAKSGEILGGNHSLLRDPQKENKKEQPAPPPTPRNYFLATFEITSLKLLLGNLWTDECAMS